MLAPYVALLRIPGVPRIVLAGLVARIPFGMVTLGIILLVEHETGSYARAGVVDAAYGVATGIASPLLGRLVDRLGQPRVLIPAALGNAAALVLLVVLTTNGAPLGALMACGALAGLSFPPLSASIRTLLPRIAGESATSAFALEAVMLDLFFVLGPPLAAALSALFSPAVAVLAGAAMSVCGVLVYATAPAPRAWRAEVVERRHWAGALRFLPVRTLMVSGLFFGATFGFSELALPAFSDARGAAETGGALSGILSVGSVLGGIVYGARRHTRNVVDRGIVLCFAFAAGLALLMIPDTVVLMGLACFVAGLALAPLTTVSFELNNAAAPESVRVEANSWVLSMNVGGMAVGSALAGLLVESQGTTAAFGAAAACAALGGVWWVARRRVLVDAVARLQPT